MSVWDQKLLPNSRGRTSFPQDLSVLSMLSALWTSKWEGGVGQGAWWLCFSVLFVHWILLVEERHISISFLRTLGELLPQHLPVTHGVPGLEGCLAIGCRTWGQHRTPEARRLCPPCDILQIYLCHHNHGFWWFTYCISCWQHKLKKWKIVYELTWNPFIETVVNQPLCMSAWGGCSPFSLCRWQKPYCGQFYHFCPYLCPSSLAPPPPHHLISVKVKFLPVTTLL